MNNQEKLVLELAETKAHLMKMRTVVKEKRRIILPRSETNGSVLMYAISMPYSNGGVLSWRKQHGESKQGDVPTRSTARSARQSPPCHPLCAQGDLVTVNLTG